MKRFWRSVAVTDEGAGFGIALDDRPVRTPGRAALTVPTSMLAEAIAGEWRAVADDLDPRAMPLTGLANAAIDRIAPALPAFAAQLAAYAANDLLCYRAAEPAPLVARQQLLWDPILDWARTRYDVHFETTAGIMHVEQPPATVSRLGDAVAARTPFEMAGLSPVVRITGSLVIGLALIEGAIRPETAWAAGECDEDWQISQWGEDDHAARARADRKREFDAGVRFLSALR